MKTSPDTEILVHTNSAGKKFCKNLKKSLRYGVQDVIQELNPFRKKRQTPDQPCSEIGLRDGEFWAVRDVSFELRRGECIGLIGHNGAGKTTLLKMLNGLIKPDCGIIRMTGRVGALIALGAGFNPILTGRENIFVNGSVLGLTHNEIKSKIDDIIDFADIRNFIDSPVQSYSSGMQVRLGFAIATAMEPDILLLDEVLAVGDASFRSKCYQRISEIRKNAAIIFVSHSMEQIARTCNKVLLMNKGTCAFYGDVPEGIQQYESKQFNAKENDAFLSLEQPITSFKIYDLTEVCKSGEQLQFRIRMTSQSRLGNLLLRIVFYNASGTISADCNADSDVSRIKIETGENEWSISINSLTLKNGLYRVSVNIINEMGSVLVWSYKEHAIQVDGSHMAALSDCQLQLESWQTISVRSPA